jgi:hypothetical protein
MALGRHHTPMPAGGGIHPISSEPQMLELSRESGKHTGKVLIAPVLEQGHFVYVVIRDAQVVIFDTHIAKREGDNKKTVGQLVQEQLMSALHQLRKASSNEVPGAVSYLGRELQEADGSGPGMPQGCGLFGALLHEWLLNNAGKDDFSNPTLLAEVDDVTSHFEEIRADEKRDLNVAMRAASFGSRVEHLKDDPENERPRA